MIYDLVENQTQKMDDAVDYPYLLRAVYNALKVEQNNEDLLAKRLREIFSLDCYSMRIFVEDNKVDYPSLIIISRSIDPDFWTNQTVRMVQTKHQRLLNELDDDGRILEKNLTQNLEEAKLVLLRYFDLLPEEENHDAELSIELLRTLKNDQRLEETMEMTEINIISLLRLSHKLSQRFWQTANGKQLRIKLLRFNSIDK